MDLLEQTVRDEILSITRRLASVKERHSGTLLIRSTGSGGATYVIESNVEGTRLRSDALRSNERAQVEIIGDAMHIVAILQGKEDAREAFQSGRLRVRGNLGHLNEILLELRIIKKPIYFLLRVTAVLTANTAGTQSLGETVGTQVRPAAPYLRDPVVHTQPGDNYVKDEINLANLQLLASGACFGLDVENLRYVIATSDLLHTRECGDMGHQATVDWLAMKAAHPIEDNPYRDSVIIIYRWGSGSQPSAQGCSGLDYPYILMPGKYYNSRLVDGQTVLGSSHLTHELGHFMGLDHPFPSLADRLAELANLRGRNLTNLPLTIANLPSLSGVTAQELYEAKALAERYIATWPYTLDQDGGIPATLPESVTVRDTPLDLGPALPLLFGFPACSGSTSYVLNRYDPAWLQPMADAAGNVVWWQPTFGAEQHQYQDRILIDDRVTNNVMGYWQCNPASQGYSADQVRRMQFVLTERRQNLIARTISLFEDFAPTRDLVRARATESRNRLLRSDELLQGALSRALPVGVRQCGTKAIDPTCGLPLNISLCGVHDLRVEASPGPEGAA